MGRTNVGKGYTQMLLREKRDVKVMAKEVCTNAPSAPVTATAPHRWLKTIENKFADALRIPSLAKPFATFRYYCLMCVYARLGLTVTRRWDKVNDAQGTNHSPLGIHFSMSNRG